MNRFSSGRRQVIGAVGTTAIATAAAGCVGSFADDGADESDRSTEDDGSRGGNVVLSPPGDDDSVGRVPFPTHGERIPDVTVPAPLRDREVTTSEFFGEAHQLYTFIFTRCHDACPGLFGALRHVQEDSIDREYAGRVAFLPFTFDPEHDTPDVLAEYEETYGVNQEVGNWYTLRPEDETRAKEVVHEEFGGEFARTESEEENEDDDFDLDDLEGAAEDVADDEGMEMPFYHINLVLLVNKAGYVERAYFPDVPDAKTVIDDTRSVVEGW